MVLQHLSTAGEVWLPGGDGGWARGVLAQLEVDQGDGLAAGLGVAPAAEVAVPRG